MLIGKTVGRKFYPDTIVIKENHVYMDIVTIKTREDSHICILTLKYYLNFNADVAPLCLPEINREKYESVDGTILGFGYKSDFPDTMKSLANDQKLKERLIAEHDYEFFNSTQCVDKYGKWHDGTVWRRKWAFKKKGKLSWINQQGYVFLEK